MGLGDWLQFNGGKKYDLNNFTDFKLEDISDPKLKKFISLFDKEGGVSDGIITKNEWKSIFTELQQASGDNDLNSEELGLYLSNKLPNEEVNLEKINELFDAISSEKDTGMKNISMEYKPSVASEIDLNPPAMTRDSVKDYGVKEVYVEHVNVIPPVPRRKDGIKPVDISKEDQLETIDYMDEMVNGAYNVMEARAEQAGLVSKAVNWWLETIDSNYAKSNVERKIEDTEADIEFLRMVYEGNAEDWTFVEAFKERRGVEYNQEYIDECKEKAQEYELIKTLNQMVGITQTKLYEATKGDVYSQMHPEISFATISEALKLCGITTKEEVNEYLHNFEERYKNHPVMKKYGHNLHAYADKNCGFAFFRIPPKKWGNNSHEPLVNEQLRLIANDLSERMYNELQKAVGGKSVDTAKREYEESFKKAFGKKDVKILAEDFAEKQAQYEAYVEIGIDILCMATMFVPGMQEFAFGWALKGARALKHARMARLALKATKYARNINNASKLISPLMTANVTFKPIQLLEKLTSPKGMSKKDWETWGLGVLENSAYIFLGYGASRLAEKAAGLFQTRALVHTLQSQGKNIEEIKAIITANASKMPEELVSCMKNIDKMAKTLQISTEAALDLSMTALANMAFSNGDLTVTDWAMSIGTALMGAKMYKQLSHMSQAEKVKCFKEVFADFGMTDKDAHSLLKIFGDIAEGKIKVEEKTGDGIYALDEFEVTAIDLSNKPIKIQSTEAGLKIESLDLPTLKDAQTGVKGVNTKKTYTKEEIQANIDEIKNRIKQDGRSNLEFVDYSNPQKYGIHDYKDLINSELITREERNMVERIYANATQKGYKDFIDANPDVLLGFAHACRNVDGKIVSMYEKLSTEQFAIIKHAKEQLNQGLIEPRYIQAIQDRIDMSTPHEIYKYVDCPEKLPDKVYSERNSQLFWTKEQCLKEIENVKTIREFLNTQSTPVDITVYRVDGYDTMKSVKIGNSNLADIMQNAIKNGNVDEVIKMLNKGDVDIPYENHIGTSLVTSKQIFDNKHAINLEIDVPAGSKGLFLESAVPDGAIYRETEFLIQMGSNFRIKGAEYKDGVWHIKADLVQDNSTFKTKPKATTQTEAQTERKALGSVKSETTNKEFVELNNTIDKKTEKYVNYVDEDGFGSEIFYDKKGQEIKTIFHDFDGSIVEHYKIYDDSGNLIAKASCKANGEWEIHKFEYDKNGRKTKEINQGKNVPYNTIDYKYDKAGNLLQEIHYGEKEHFTRIHEYDSNGNKICTKRQDAHILEEIIEERYHYENNKLQSTYKNDGHSSTYCIYNNDGSHYEIKKFDSHFTISTYNNKSEPVKLVKVTSNNTSPSKATALFGGEKRILIRNINDVANEIRLLTKNIDDIELKTYINDRLNKIDLGSDVAYKSIYELESLTNAYCSLNNKSVNYLNNGLIYRDYMCEKLINNHFGKIDNIDVAKEFKLIVADLIDNNSTFTVDDIIKSIGERKNKLLESDKILSDATKNKLANLDVIEIMVNTTFKKDMALHGKNKELTFYLKADDIKEEIRIGDLIKYCENYGKNNKWGKKLYSQYVKNLDISNELKQQLMNIESQYGTKIFLSMGSADEAIKIISEEFAKWRNVGGNETKFPSVLKNLDSEKCFEENFVAGYCSAGTDKISIAGSRYMEKCLRHEMTHLNDKFIDLEATELFNEIKTSQKYTHEFRAAGINDSKIDYAYTNKKEFIAVASEGDMSKYSAEFKQVLIDFGMPEWVLKLK